MIVDWTQYRRVGAIARGGENGLVTDAGDAVETTSPAPGVVRLRVGPRTRPDYGILVDPPPGAASATSDARLDIGNDPLRFSFSWRGREVLRSIRDEHFRGWTRIPVIGRGPQGWVVAFDLDDDEPVYGLGEKFARLDRRGQIVVSRVEDALGVNTELAYKNVPFCWSPRGWGVFVNTPGRVTHGVGHGPWSHRSYAAIVEDEALDLFFIAGDSPAEILARYTALTGRSPSIPDWSFGLWLSRAYYRTPDEALAAAREMRARRIPCDTIVFDGRAWQDTPTRFHFHFDPKRFADARATIAELGAMNFRVCVWEYPLVSIDGPYFKDFAARGWLLKRRDGSPYVYDWDVKPGTSPFGSVLTPLPPSGLPDFTHPELYAWWRDSHKALFDLGVDAVKPDFGEQVPDDAVAHNGDTGARLHNVYPQLYTRCVYEATARYGRGTPIVWGRAGWAGVQRYPMQWGGDPQSDWGGFAASIRGGLSYQMSGAAFHSTDVGGFYGAQPGAELYLRWTAQAVFSSHMRYHGIGAREPWAFGPEAEAIARKLIEFRYRLIPYLRRLAEAATATGMPTMRAMPLAFPGDRPGRGFDTQYMLGPALLVAPIVRPGGAVEAWLPEGTWFDIWTGERLEGGRVVERREPLDRIPVFGRAGESLPLGRVVQHSGEIDPARPVEEVWTFGPAAIERRRA